MTRRTRTWLIAAVVLLAYGLAAWKLGTTLGLTGRDLLLLRWALVALGVVSAAVILWFFRGPKEAPLPPDELDAAIAQARTRLAAAKLPGKKNLDTLPVVLLLGPAGSAKTTAVLRAGMNADLLAGEALRGETVTPTTAANVWYAQDAVFVEAGGALAKDAPRLARLVKQLQPARLRAAITGGTQAPRAAVVCFSCEELVRPGGGAAVTAAAQELRTRLGEVAQQLGIRLPVYVLFTKADAIPHFDEFVQHFTADEARQLVGAGLAADAGPAGTYAERAGAAVSSALDEIYVSLAAARLPVLHREQTPERKPGAYEFPREFRKVQPLVIDFLRELCRPSQLAVNPVLRGFYFTGVQAVFVQDAGQQAAAAPAAAAPMAAAASATAVFSAQQARAAAATPSYTPPRVRKIARWDFLEGLFPQVVLADGSALHATLGGTRLHGARRLLLGGATALALLLAAAFSVSYASNRALQRDVAASARALAAVSPAATETPSTEALARLDSVRATLDRLAAYERDGAPLGMRWGLYRGGALYDATRRLYFDAFDRLLFGATRAALVGTLTRLPDQSSPTDDYGTGYDALKAHLITTSNPEKATADFLPGALLQAWSAGRGIDEERRALARRQFETYARELAVANPYAYKPDAQAVPHARAYLHSFVGVAPIFAGLVAEAGKSAAPVDFAKLRPDAARVVSAPYVVPAAFTKDGFAIVQKKLQSPEALLKGEAWVVGEQSVVAPTEREKTIRTLRAMYDSAYAEQWRTFLRQARVAPIGMGSVAQVEQLAGNQSPLLQLFAVVAQHTAVSKPLAATFQSAQSLVPAAPGAPLLTEKNQPYVQAIGGLRDALRQVASAPPTAKEGAAQQAKTSAEGVRSAGEQLALGFAADEVGRADGDVKRLLTDWPKLLVGQLTDVGPAQARAAIAAFCAQLGGLARSFPIDPDASRDASVQELADALRPGSGKFATLTQGLASVVQREGRVYKPTNPNVPVSRGFLRLLAKLSDVSEALFPNGAQQPRVAFSVTLDPSPRELASVALNLDGDPLKATQNSASGSMQLPGPGAQASLKVAQGATESSVAGPFGGPWAALRIFHRARVQSQGSDLRVDWAVPNVMRGGENVRVSGRISGLSDANGVLFRREDLQGGSCP